MSTLIRWEPARELGPLRQHMDRLLSEAMGRGWGAQEGLSAAAWIPAVDVYETPESIVIKADLPDVNKDEIDISVHNHALTIRGERKREQETEEKSFYRSERVYGTFSRSFTLPPAVETEKIEAAFHNGVLRLTLPKREESKPKQIQVKVDGAK